MERQKKSWLKKQAGFTLIEIIAVLVLLGILASIAIPKYFDMQKEAKLKVARSLVASTVQGFSTAYNGYMLTGKEPQATDAEGGKVTTTPIAFCEAFVPESNDIQVICETDTYVQDGKNTWAEIRAIRVRGEDCSVDPCKDFTHKGKEAEVLAKVWTHPSYVDQNTNE